MNIDQSGELRTSLERLRAELGRESPIQQHLQAIGVTPDVVEQALKRYEEGNYGVCRVCHLTIPVGELLAEPYVNLCRRCRRRAPS